MHCQLGQVGGAAERLSRFGKEQTLSKRQEICQNAIDGKLRVQDRASERMQDQIIEEIKELLHTKTEEALQLAEKEHDLWMFQNEKRRKQKKMQVVRKPRKDGLA